VTRDEKPGGFSPAEMREILALQPMPAAWRPAEVGGDSFPVFLGKTYAEAVTAFREANAAKQKNYWTLAAIAFRIERAVGGRPKHQDDERDTRKADTAIQRFCKDVGISRNTFQRLTRTYGVFFETRTKLGTSFRHVLSFGHHEIAGRLTDSAEEAINAVAFAHSVKWSATMLERMLVLTADRPKPNDLNRWLANGNPGRRMKKFLETFFRRLERTIDLWPADMRRRAPYLLWLLAEHVKGTLPPADDDLPACLRELVVADDSDPIGRRDMEAQ